MEAIQAISESRSGCDLPARDVDFPAQEPISFLVKPHVPPVDKMNGTLLLPSYESC